MTRLAVCGLGYVGLVTAACFAGLGHEVDGYDADATTVHRLRRGEIPFHEPDLAAIVARTLGAGKLRFWDHAESALERCEAVFIAVGTPVDPVGAADLSFVRQAARDIGRCARGDLVVINKSTVPVETADLVARLIESAAGGRLRVSVASNPEFLREGSAVRDFLNPDRIVIGSEDPAAIEFLRRLYAGFDAPLVVVATQVAEVIKYASNAFLALRISFANELANFCDATGVNVDDVLAGLSLDRRIGGAYLRPGLGYGGSCLPKDVHALTEAARTRGLSPALLEAVARVNDRQVAVMLQRIERTAGDLDGVRAGVLGLSFKPGTDDVRASPAIALANALCARGARVVAHDPAAAAKARSRLDPRAQIETDVWRAVHDADFVVIATEWPLYCGLDLARLRSALKRPLIFDGRNALDAQALAGAGFAYHGIGRSTARQGVAT